MHLLFAFPTQKQTNARDGKRKQMKNVFTTLMTSAALLFTIGSGLQAQTVRMHAAVPFAWELNGHQMTAGDYQISRDANTSVTLIQNRSTGKGSYVAPIPDAEKNSAAQLVFHRYGDQYFLAEIDAPGQTSAKLPVSRAEKAVQSEQPPEMAMVVVTIKPILN